jgi:hypothetical protein
MQLATGHGRRFPEASRICRRSPCLTKDRAWTISKKKGSTLLIKSMLVKLATEIHLVLPVLPGTWISDNGWYNEPWLFRLRIFE